MKNSEVLAILKRRIYHGKTKDNSLDDLKSAASEILDWVDKQLSPKYQPTPRPDDLRDSVFRLLQNEHFARENFFASDQRSDADLADDIVKIFVPDDAKGVGTSVVSGEQQTSQQASTPATTLSKEDR